MAADFEIDSREFRAAAQKLLGLMWKTVQEFITQQARLFVRDCLRATPPFGRNSITESFASQRKIGESAVRRDVRKVFALAEDLTIVRAPTNEKLGAGLRKYIRAGNMDAVRDILSKIGMPQVKLLSRAEPGIHASARGTNGRVVKGNKHLVLSASSVNQYVRQIVSHVGKFKSGWLMAANGLGLKGIPAWIRRHSEPGVFENNLNHPTEPSVTVGNLSKGASKTEADIMSFAYQNRLRSMKAEAEKRLQHEFNKVNAR